MKRKWGDGDVLVRALLLQAGLWLGRVQHKANCQGGEVGQPRQRGESALCPSSHRDPCMEKKKDIFLIFLHFGG